ncbi:PTS sugar transporter subunit IIA [Lactovum odontotermitis]
MTEYLDGKIAFFHENFQTQTDLFSFLAHELQEKDFVTKDFFQKICEREIIFPTGLFVNGIGVAIPHTDSDWVKRSQIAFMSLENPMTFYEMGTNDKEIAVNLVFMLALKEPHEQPEMLMKLIAMFQADKVLESLSKVDKIEDYLQILQNNGIN